MDVATAAAEPTIATRLYPATNAQPIPSLTQPSTGMYAPASMEVRVGVMMVAATVEAAVISTDSATSPCAT